MTLQYGSVCSGIEAASVAWEPLGFQPVFFSEIEPFPSEVLAHHFGSNLPNEPHSRNSVPNYGDMTKFKDWPDATLDILVGGTPCQPFSIAGLRKGLDDPRGNLTLVYLGLVERYRPKWVVWENVPGVLSIDGGRAFSAFLGGLGQLGYGWSYRVLDAQFCRVDGHAGAVPQRRRRVFVVGHSSGDFRRAAAVLLEPEGLRGDSAPRRKAGQGASNAIGGGPDGGRIAGNVSSKWAKGTGGPAGDEAYNLIAFPERMSATQYASSENLSPALGALDPTAVAFAIQERAVSENPNAGPGGMGVQADIAYTLEARRQVQACAFDMRGREGGAQFEGPHDTANIRAANGGSSRSYVAQPYAVRRLTPTECERLQGFPDGWTDIPRKGGKPAADGPRYKALGNSMACNVMRWIGMRIQIAEEAFNEMDGGKK